MRSFQILEPRATSSPLETQVTQPPIQEILRIKAQAEKQAVDAEKEIDNLQNTPEGAGCFCLFGNQQRNRLKKSIKAAEHIRTLALHQIDECEQALMAQANQPALSGTACVISQQNSYLDREEQTGGKDFGGEREPLSANALSNSQLNKVSPEKRKLQEATAAYNQALADHKRTLGARCANISVGEEQTPDQNQETFHRSESKLKALAYAGQHRALAERQLAEVKQIQVPFHNMRSISVCGLIHLKELLAKLEFFERKRPISSTTVREFILAGNPHPASMFPHCFSEDPPIIALTYEWRLDFDGIFSFLNTKQMMECNSTWNEKLPTDMSEIRIWIDVLFIDQLSSDIASCLEASEIVYRNAMFHLMLITDTIFTRAWCLFELAVRRQAQKGTLAIKSCDESICSNLVSDGNFFEGMKASNEGDKERIVKKITEAFDCVATFNYQMKVLFRALQGRWLPPRQ